MRIDEVRPADIRKNLAVLLTPFVPGSHSLLQLSDVLVICHVGRIQMDSGAPNSAAPLLGSLAHSDEYPFLPPAARGLNLELLHVGVAESCVEVD